MAILITALKQQLLNYLDSDFRSGNNKYYLGIGRSQLWNDSDVAPAPVNSRQEVFNFQTNLQAVKQMSDISYVVPRINWSAGTIYEPYDDAIVSNNSDYYVLTSSNAVYVCLQQGRDALGNIRTSVVEPSSTLATPQTTADGYVWKFLYSLSALERNRFLAANYMPVRYIDSSDGSIRENEQVTIQNAAVNGQVIGIQVVNGGTGYASAPAVTIVGDGDSATATATISGGSVVKVEMSNYGSNYSYASVHFASGNATARAILAPPGGIGADPVKDLRASALMFNSQPSDTEGGEFLIDQEFRQVGIIKNIRTPNDSDFINVVGIALNKLTFAPGATGFVADNLIVGATSNAKAYIDFVDSSAGVYYHQDQTTGFRSFITGESLSSTNLNGVPIVGSGVADSDLPATVDKYTGEVLYIDNRTAILRSNAETQDIKLIVQL